MRKSRGCVSAAVAVLALGLLAAGPAAGMSSPNYAIEWDVLASAGGAGASPGYALSATAGQPTPVGESSSTGYRLAAGYWVGASAKDIEGSLAAGGAPVVGTSVKLNLGRTVVGRTTADAGGRYGFDGLTPGSYKITIGTFRVNQVATVSGTLLVKGAAPAGQRVKLKSLDTGQILREPVDARGAFAFADVAAGRYKITIVKLPVP